MSRKIPRSCLGCVQRLLLPFPANRLTAHLQLRAERYERERDDPYHMGRSSSYRSGSDDDVDSIPIVNLDIDLRSPPARTPTPPPREPTPPPMEVDIEGELPPGLAAPLAPRPTSTRSVSPVEPPQEEKVEPFAEVKESRAEEGAAVKVVKKKKGKAGEGKSTTTKKSKKEVALDE